MTEADGDCSLVFELPENDPLFEKKKVRFINRHSLLVLFLFSSSILLGYKSFY